MVLSNTLRLPSLSARMPKKMPPIGLNRNPAANTARVFSNAEVALLLSKSAAAMYTDATV
ncbi:hypothetical protein D3C84_1110380 [compost metagenome]